MAKIEIWEPRWHDRVVLIAKYKVGQRNTIVFTKTGSLKGEYYMSGDDIRRYPLETNGRVACYAVPLNKLEKRDGNEQTHLL